MVSVWAAERLPLPKEMTMALLGADVEALEQLAKKFGEVAQQIEQLKTQVSGQLHGVEWKGQDADKFRQDWESQGTKSLQQVTTMLHAAGELARKQAGEQRQVSST
jgi:uncharacterized protein YukE